MAKQVPFTPGRSRLRALRASKERARSNFKGGPVPRAVGSARQPYTITKGRKGILFHEVFGLHVLSNTGRLYIGLSGVPCAEMTTVWSFQRHEEASLSRSRG